MERVNSLRTILKANKVVKPHPSPLPPPPQSFSDSPRKRRGRGNLSTTGSTVGQASGTNNKRSDSAHRRQGHQSKLTGSNTIVTYANNIQATVQDNALYTLPESFCAIPDKPSKKSDDRIESELMKVNASSEESVNTPSARMGSIVSVETKYLTQKGDCNISSAAV